MKIWIVEETRVFDDYTRPQNEAVVDGVAALRLAGTIKLSSATCSAGEVTATIFLELFSSITCDFVPPSRAFLMDDVNAPTHEAFVARVAIRDFDLVNPPPWSPRLHPPPFFFSAIIFCSQTTKKAVERNTIFVP